MDTARLLLLLLLTAGAIALSWHAWWTQHAYGLFRFFAFEAIILLIILNSGRWFRDPLSGTQVVSWVLLVASLSLAAHGVHLLRAVARAHIRWIEDTQSIVRIGAYRYIRHPLYASLLLFAWGVFLKGADLPSGALALAATAFLIATAQHEEDFNIDRFGAAYSEYMKRTKMLIPFLL